MKISKNLIAKLAALSVATVGLSGCVYDVGLGYASDGYGYDSYDCDPYSPFDSYYTCDSGYGFYNIGFGGGWYDNYWYPGYGYYVFDNYGRRHNMHDHHRRYWGDRRQRWYRDNRRHGDGYGKGRGHRRGEGRDHGYNHNAVPRQNSVDEPIAWPETHGGRRGERPGRPRMETPPPGAVNAGGWQDRGRHDGRGRGEGRGPRRDGQSAPNAGYVQPQAAPQPMAEPAPGRRNDGFGGGGGAGRNAGRFQQPSSEAMPQRSAAPQPVPQPQYTPLPPPPPREAPRTMREAPDRLPD